MRYKVNRTKPFHLLRTTKNYFAGRIYIAQNVNYSCLPLFHTE